MRTSRARSLRRTKIKSLKELSKTAGKLKAAGKKIVFTNGCFDILHYGHVQYLEKAKNSGDILVVAINSDSSIRRIKGKNRPIISQRDRARVLAGLESVDFVVIFNQDTPLKTIQAINPDILIKGGDWSKDKIVGADFVRNKGGKITTVKLAAGRSTTNIIEKIKKIALNEKSKSRKMSK